MTSSYSQRITEAVLARAQPRSKGISIASIKGFHAEMTWNTTAFKKALDKLVESEELTRTKNSYKLSPAARKVAIKHFGEPNFDDVASPTARKVCASPRPQHATEAEPSSLLSLPGGVGRRDARGACARGAAGWSPPLQPPAPALTAPSRRAVQKAGSSPRTVKKTIAKKKKSVKEAVEEEVAEEAAEEEAEEAEAEDDEDADADADAPAEEEDDAAKEGETEDAGMIAPEEAPAEGAEAAAEGATEV